jgi:hypothetical protein
MVSKLNLPWSITKICHGKKKLKNCHEHSFLGKKMLCTTLDLSQEAKKGMLWRLTLPTISFAHGEKEKKEEKNVLLTYGNYNTFVKLIICTKGTTNRK